MLTANEKKLLGVYKFMYYRQCTVQDAAAFEMRSEEEQYKILSIAFDAVDKARSERKEKESFCTPSERNRREMDTLRRNMEMDFSRRSMEFANQSAQIHVQQANICMNTFMGF